MILKVLLSACRDLSSTSLFLQSARLQIPMQTMTCTRSAITLAAWQVVTTLLHAKLTCQEAESNGTTSTMMLYQSWHHKASSTRVLICCSMSGPEESGAHSVLSFPLQDHFWRITVYCLTQHLSSFLFPSAVRQVIALKYFLVDKCYLRCCAGQLCSRNVLIAFSVDHFIFCMFCSIRA